MSLHVGEWIAVTCHTTAGVLGSVAVLAVVAVAAGRGLRDLAADVWAALRKVVRR